MNTSPPRPYILAETNWKVVQETPYEVAILPWGATEAHNYHLPYATDNFQVEYVAAEAARQAWEAGSKVIVLPTVPFGVNTGQLDIDLCLNMNPSTQLALLKDLVDVAQRAGIRKFVILNGHGGNHFKIMIRELAFFFPEVFVSTVGWFDIGDWHDYVEHPGDHAGEMETSLMLHIAPNWVMPLSEAGDGAAKQYKIRALREGWASAQRQWTKVTKDTGVGNPYQATAEKGAKFLEYCTGELSIFFSELAAVDVDDLYE